LIVVLFAAATAALPQATPVQDKALEEMMKTFVTEVIPSANQDFAPFKLRNVNRTGAKLAVPEGWRAEISIDGIWADFTCSYPYYYSDSKKPWFYAEDGGQWLIPLYETIRRVLSELLKEGWERSSEEDTRVGDADTETGSQTHWRRPDGLWVRLSRCERWDDVPFDKKIKKKYKKDHDLEAVPYVCLHLSVIKWRRTP
jgi:hypothetical protein